jgi:hypothetical protein
MGNLFLDARLRLGLKRQQAVKFAQPIFAVAEEEKQRDDGTEPSLSFAKPRLPEVREGSPGKDQSAAEYPQNPALHDAG